MRHADARVRWQAVKLQLKLPAERDEALIAGLRDQDPRTLRLALSIAVALQAWPDTAVPLLVNRATDRTLAGDLRALAVRCLGYTKASAALETLLQLTAGGRTLFGRGKPAGQGPPPPLAPAALAARGGAHPPGRAPPRPPAPPPPRG